MISYSDSLTFLVFHLVLRHILGSKSATLFVLTLMHDNAKRGTLPLSWHTL